MLDRSHFLLDDLAFLNHGSFGACPRELLDVQRRWQEQLEQQPVQFFRDLPARLQHARRCAAEYFHAQASDLVFVTNSTFGVNVAAHAARRWLNPGDRILTTDHEYGACLRAWQHHLHGSGVEIDVCTLGLPVGSRSSIVAAMQQAVTERTRLIFMSHITSPTAIVMPVEEICSWARERGIVTVIDGAHVPGQRHLDLTTLQADVYTGNFHKWMCTPKGSAFLWVSPQLQDRMVPLVTSWGGEIPTTGEGLFVDEHDYLGTRDPSPFLTVGDAFPWMQRVGWDSVVARAQRLRDATMEALVAYDGVEPISDWKGDGSMMGAVRLDLKDDALETQQRLLHDHKIEVVLWPWLGSDILRFSVHAHTRDTDLEQLIEVLPRFLA
jgi:isopenicillin-N epimerase